MYLQVIRYELREVEDDDDEIHEVEGDDDKNGPKRTRNASVWALGEFFIIFFVFFHNYG